MNFISGIKFRELVVVVTMMLLTVFGVVPLEALATATPTTSAITETSSLDGVICNAVGQLQGPVARGIAAIAIIFLGFSLFLGKISWGVALALAIGVGAVFGANSIVKLLSGTQSCTG